MTRTNTSHMTFPGALRSELMRRRRSPLIVLHLICGVAGGAACGAYFAVSVWDPALGADAFAQFLGALMPLMAAIVCGLATDEERTAGRLANLLAVPSRSRAVLAAWASLSLLGAFALLVAHATFSAILAASGRLTLGAGALALSWVGTVLGSLPLYAACLASALRFGRNVTIGMGAAGTLVAFFSVGGLAHGLMTGELTGALPSVLAWIPFAWPARLGSLGIEAAIVAGRDAGQMAAVHAAASGTAGACALLTIVAAILLARWFRHFEEGGIHA